MFVLFSDMMNETENGLIGVHCLHGLNRTGYMICRYLIEKVQYIRSLIPYE